MASPPTARVLDVIELLARSADRSFTLAQIVRELRITWATGHAILATLVERGWASRDETDKSFRLGPALAVASDEAVAARPLGRLVRRAADDLSRELVVHPVTWERGDSFCEDQYVESQPYELPTAPVRVTVAQLEPPPAKPAFSKFDFEGRL